MMIKGKGVVEGVALSKVLNLIEDFETPLSNYVQQSSSEEIAKFKKAVEIASKQIEALISDAEKIGNVTQIEVMTAHLLMVTDVAIEESVINSLEMGSSAPSAVTAATDEMAALLASLDDEYLKERSKDVLDIGKRLLRILLKMKPLDLESEQHVLCGDDIEPSTIANLNREYTMGIVLGQGSTTSHAVIIAKTLGIPTIVGLGKSISALNNTQSVYLDGSTGEIVVNPDAEDVQQFEAKKQAWREKNKIYAAIKHNLGMTLDGKHIPLAINVGNPKDVEGLSEFGGEGVGLYRTEFVFMGRTHAPNEEEQFNAYKAVVSACGDKLCVIRTLDIGGDKPASYLEIGDEANPFLGWRAIRISLDRVELFKTQVRAILRASHFGKAAIMLPMIISLEEVRSAKKYINEVMEDLASEGIPFDQEIEIGIMIETPSAVLLSPLLAKNVDFFSVGTNDLTQYTLAVDRGNPKISHLYDTCHPAVIRELWMISNAAKEANIWIGMCGEMAGDLLTLPLLVAMGFDELSMSAPSVPKVKDFLSRLSVDQRMLDDVLKLETAHEIRELLTHYLKHKA